MKTRLLLIWDTLHTSYWFIPSLMTLLSILLSVVTLDLEQHVKKEWVYEMSFIWSGGPEGAREVLSTIAGSMITVAGVVFSITIVALTLASSQFGPRLLRNFMADTGNQVVLGTFISTYIYCLLILRSVQGIEEHTFVPYISVTVGLLLAVLSLGVLIYFIHHVSDSIQAENLIATVGHELLEAIEEMFPEKAGEPGTPEEADPELPENLEENAAPILATRNGYLQSVNNELLVETAAEYNVIISIIHRPGTFISKGAELVKVYPTKSVSEKLIDELLEAFITGNHRTPTQDVAYPVHQLVEVALRALSPSVNDPYTALSCIDWLGTGLLQMLERKYPSKYRYDTNHKLRMIGEPYSFPLLASATFNPIRNAGKEHLIVLTHLLDKIQILSTKVVRSEDMHMLKFHARQLYADGINSLINEQDRHVLHNAYSKTKAKLI